MFAPALSAARIASNALRADPFGELCPAVVGASQKIDTKTMIATVKINRRALCAILVQVH